MIYCFLADGFEEVEALSPVDILRRAGLEVKTVGVGGQFITSSHGIIVKSDLTIDKINVHDSLDAVILPGGMPGTLNLEASDAVQATIDECAKNGKLICAICAAPSILGHKGLLKGKKATVFPGFEKDLIGADATGESVVKDGNIITAKGAGVAVQFGLEIVAALISKEKSNAIKASIQCQ